jgi:hypothetical protein
MFGLACSAAPEPGISGDAGAPLTAGQVLTTDATVQFVNVEGGCWVLATPGGRYQPVSLPSEFQVDGKLVRVSLRAAPDVMSICMVAPIVRVDSISAR